MCWLEWWKCSSFRLVVFIERALLDFFSQIFITSQLIHIQGKCEILKTSHLWFWHSEPCFDWVVLVCFPKQRHPLWHGEHWWCSVSEKHILLVPEFSSKLLIPILCDLTLGSIYSPHRQAGHGNHITAATYWRWLWDACVYTSENTGVLEPLPHGTLKEAVLCLDVCQTPNLIVRLCHFTSRTRFRDIQSAGRESVIGLLWKNRPQCCNESNMYF